MPNFAAVAKKVQKANASVQNANQTDHEMPDVLIHASKIMGGTRLRTAMARTLNYFGAT